MSAKIRTHEEALQQIEIERLGKDFSIRRVAEVLAFPS